MNIIIDTIYIFLQIVYWIVIFDVILSWLMIFGLKARPKFIAEIIDPMYSKVRKILPTRIGPLDLTPIVVILLIYFTMGVLNIITSSL